MSERPLLRALAERAGIVDAFVGWNGEIRRSSDATYEAILSAMGLDASSEQRAQAALAQLDETATVADRVVIVAVDADAGDRVRLPVPAGIEEGHALSLEVIFEHGGRIALESGPQAHQRHIEIHTAGAALGCHRAIWRSPSLDPQRPIEQLLVLHPPSCHRIDDALGDARSFGVTANLYSLRSARDWGIGDLTDLATLARWTGDVGGSFVGINPLGMLRNRGAEVCPYFPVSRLFRNPIYIDVESVPELRSSPRAQAVLASDELRRTLADLRSLDFVDHEAVAALKRSVLEPLHARFREICADPLAERTAAYRRYREREGRPLDDLACFAALSEAYPDHAAWPAELRRHEPAALDAFGDRNRIAVDFHRYLQFETDRQLAGAASHGLRVGLYEDLALGSAADGADAWMFPELFVTDASLGAPPDAYAREGQDWGLPPLHPRRMLDEGYVYWRRLLAGAMRHAGALRIDHAMALERQYWIPAGMSAEQGAYVRYPAHELFAILALESRRYRCVVIGEDLGTVPEGFREKLTGWGALRSQVVYFEREGERFREPHEYDERSLATVNTHDLPTLAGYATCRDLQRRLESGDVEADEAGARRQERERDLQSLRDALITAGVLDPSRADPDPAELVRAAHSFLARTSARLVAAALDDIAGEVDAVNFIGAGEAPYPKWSRRMGVDVADLDRELLGDLPVVRALQRADPEPPGFHARSPFGNQTRAIALAGGNSMTQTRYRFEIRDPENSRNALISMESVTPFMSVRTDDILNHLGTPDHALDGRVFRVTGVHHGITGNAQEGYLHSVIVMTEELDPKDHHPLGDH